MFDIKKVIEKYGKENIRIYIHLKPLNRCLFISYTSSIDPDFLVMCEITEERYKLEDNYKISVKPINHEDYFKEDHFPMFETKHFYIRDFNKIVDDGHINVFIDVSKEEI